MQYKYSLSGWRITAMRVLAVVFLLTVLHSVATLPLPLVAPDFMVIEFTADRGGWRIDPDVIALLPPESQVAVEADPGATARFHARLGDGTVRAKLFALELIGRAARIALFLCVGIALWRSARDDVDAALRAVPWLLRGTAAAIGYATVTPVAEGLRTMLLLDTVVPPAMNDFHIDLDVVQNGLMFALAAWAATWAIAAGLRARAELSTIL